MSSIAAPAVHLSAETGPGKTPASSGTRAGIAKGDFREHLAVVKPTAKSAAQADSESGTARPAESDDAATDLTPTATTSECNTDALTVLLAPTPGKGAANAKAPKAAKKDPAAPTQSPAQTAPASAALAAIAATSIPSAAPQASATAPVPADAIVTSTGHKSLQPHGAIATETILKTPPDGWVQQAAPEIIVQPPAANPQTASAATSVHKQATPQTSTKISDITAQLAKALPETPKVSAGTALHVALKPEKLGTITVKIQNSGGGDANVTITASQPETLEALKKDANSLNQILTNAGVPEAGRQIEFRAEPVAAALASAGIGNAGASMQGNAGQHESQNGTGFASSSPNAASAISGPATLPVLEASSGAGVNLIA